MVETSDHRAMLATRLGLDASSRHLDTALTHSSYAGEHGVASNERYEFLGDAVVNLAIADAILRDYPDLDEGSGSLARSRTVNEASLAAVARELGVEHALRLGKGEAKSGGAQRPSLLSDAFEALMAAIYFERGADAAITTAQQLLSSQLDQAVRSPLAADPKSQLRQWAEAEGLAMPNYVVTSSGPDHDPTFHVVVTVSDRTRGEATGRSKKAAEAAAALLAWEGRHDA